MPRPKPTHPTRPAAPRDPEHPDIDPFWLLKAIGLTIVAALLCAYLAVCLLVYQGAWQLVLQPSARIDRTPAVPFQPIRFDAAATGNPRLTAWFLPATPSAPTILYLHDGSGNLSTNVDRLTLLHDANLNVFAIDYRGFGQSEGPHPTEVRMTEDSEAALDYLVNTRHLAPATIVPLGVGLGATLAARLARAHPELPALILDDPDPSPATRALHDRRTTFVPVSLLLRDRFDLAPALAGLHQPKLILLESNSAPLPASTPDPKLSVTLPAPGAPLLPQLPTHDATYTQAIHRFLDQYLKFN